MDSLQPLIVILGGVREILVGAKDEDRKSRRRSQKGGLIEDDQKIVRKWPVEWKQAHGFVVLANRSFASICYNSPIGRIALARYLPNLRAMREQLLQESAMHNRENRHWQITVELTWEPLSMDARSTLLTLCSTTLPKTFFQEEFNGDIVVRRNR